MESFYRQVLKRAWNLSWKYKWLWIFGFFATFLGNGTFYEAIVRSFSNLSDGQNIYFTWRQYYETGILSLFSWTKLATVFEQNATGLTLSLITFIALGALLAFFIIMAVTSQASLVKAAINLDQKKKISFHQAFAGGLKKFGAVFGLNIITRIILAGLVVGLAFLVSLGLSGANWWNYILYFLAFALLLILGIIIYFLTIYATGFIVLRDKKITTAIRYAWYLFRRNILMNLEIGLILFVVSIGVALLTVVISIFILSPFILVYLLMLLMSINAGLWLLTLLISILIFLLLIITGAWFTSFQVATWALLFEELAMKRGSSKLVRVVKAIHHRLKRKGKRK